MAFRHIPPPWRPGIFDGASVRLRTTYTKLGQGLAAERWAAGGRGCAGAGYGTTAAEGSENLRSQRAIFERDH